MKLLWKLSREAIRYKALYAVAILAALSVTLINLAAPKVLSFMTAVVEDGVDEAGLSHNQAGNLPHTARITETRYFIRHDAAYGQDHENRILAVCGVLFYRQCAVDKLWIPHSLQTIKM